MLKIGCNLIKAIAIVTCFAVTTMFSGCNDKEPEIKVEDKKVLSQTVFADQTEGASGVTIVTSGAWSSTITEGSVKSTKSGTTTWVSISPDYGTEAGTYTIVINLETNTTRSDRSATITITCNGENIIITITQKATKEDGKLYPPFVGSGTGAEPYLIGTAEQLAALAELVNEGNTDYNNKYYMLTADINLDVAPYNIGAGWTPIGKKPSQSVSYDFRGNFNGNNKKVSGLYINNNNLDYAGLFGWVHNCTVQNMSVEGEVVGNDFVGGVVGFVDFGGSIINCFSAVTVSGNRNVGGVAGLVGNSSITYCYATGAVSGFHSIGGVAGSVSGSSIAYCYATGTVSGKDDRYGNAGGRNTGGVVGWVGDGGSVTNCYAMGNVSGYTLVGGIAGGGNVTNCYATGAVSAISEVGGITGSGSVENCAALNPSITRIVFPNITINVFYFFRVVGYPYGFNNIAFINNVAWDGMVVMDEIVTDGLSNNINGANITSAEIKADGTIGGRFTETNGWTIENGRLPDLFGKTVELPEHLK